MFFFSRLVKDSPERLSVAVVQNGFDAIANENILEDSVKPILNAFIYAASVPQRKWGHIGGGIFDPKDKP